MSKFTDSEVKNIIQFGGNEVCMFVIAAKIDKKLISN